MVFDTLSCIEYESSFKKKKQNTKILHFKILVVIRIFESKIND